MKGFGLTTVPPILSCPCANYTLMCMPFRYLRYHDVRVNEFQPYVLSNMRVFWTVTLLFIVHARLSARCVVSVASAEDQGHD